MTLVKYVVAWGKALTSKKGILGPGEQVEPKYFTHGEETFDANVKKGFIVTYEDYKKGLHISGIKDPNPPKKTPVAPKPAPEPEAKEEPPELILGTKKRGKKGPIVTYEDYKKGLDISGIKDPNPPKKTPVPPKPAPEPELAKEEPPELILGTKKRGEK